MCLISLFFLTVHLACKYMVSCPGSSKIIIFVLMQEVQSINIIYLTLSLYKAAKLSEYKNVRVQQIECRQILE